MHDVLRVVEARADGPGRAVVFGCAQEHLKDATRRIMSEIAALLRVPPVPAAAAGRAGAS